MFIAYLIMYAKVAGCSRWIVHAYVLFIFLLYSTHNVFQAPGLLFLYALLIAALSRPKEAGVGLAGGRFRH